MTRGQHVLLVDDDAKSGGELAHELTRNGLHVTRVHTAAEAMAVATSHTKRFDVIILEAQLPDGDGCELCAKLRRSGLQLPILMLSAAAEAADVVRGLDAGADDYMTKPFRIAPLMARLRAHTRSYQTNSYAMLAVGPLNFNPGKRLLFDPVGNRPKRLTAKEAAIFAVLYRAREKPVDRTQLMRDVWGDKPDLQSHAVEAMIYRLRQKIEPRPSRPAFLLKVPEGYRLVDPSRTPAPSASRIKRRSASPEHLTRPADFAPAAAKQPDASA